MQPISMAPILTAAEEGLGHRYHRPFISDSVIKLNKQACTLRAVSKLPLPARAVRKGRHLLSHTPGLWWKLEAQIEAQIANSSAHTRRPLILRTSLSLSPLLLPVSVASRTVSSSSSTWLFLPFLLQKGYRCLLLSPDLMSQTPQVHQLSGRCQLHNLEGSRDHHTLFLS